MANITQFNIGGTSYNVKDTEARNIFDIESDVSEITTIDLNTATVIDCTINNLNKWAVNSGTAHMIPLYGYDRIKIEAKNNTDIVYAVLTSSSVAAGTVPDFSAVNTARIILSSGDTAELSLPYDARYLYCTRTNASSQDRRPSSIVLFKEKMGAIVRSSVVYDDFAFLSGSYDSTDGSIKADNTKIRSTTVTAVMAEKGDYVYSDGIYEYRVLAYNERNSGSFVGIVNTWTINPVIIPESFFGKYICLVMRKKGNPSEDISSEVSDMSSHIFYVKSTKTIDDATFMHRGYLNTLEITSLADCVKPGWYGCASSYTANITDLPDSFPASNPIILFVHDRVGSSSTNYIRQELTSTIGNTWIRMIKKDGTVQKDWWCSDESNYWSGKTIAWFGDSLSYGAALTEQQRKNAFPFLVAKELGADITNYAIGGSTLAKQADTYDEIVFSMEEFNSMEKNVNYKYLVKDNPSDAHPYRIYKYENSEWIPAAGGTRAALSNGRSPMVDVATGISGDPDIIIVAMAWNDFYYHFTPFGDASSRDKNTFCGAMHTLCNYLQNTYTTKQIIFIGVTNSRYQLHGENAASDWDCTTPDSAYPGIGKTINDYMDAAANVCNYYSIPFINLGKDIGFAPYKYPDEYFYKGANSDKTHFNVEGHKRVASVLINKLRALRS